MSDNHSKVSLNQRGQYKYPVNRCMFADSATFAKWLTMVATLVCIFQCIGPGATNTIIICLFRLFVLKTYPVKETCSSIGIAIDSREVKSIWNSIQGKFPAREFAQPFAAWQAAEAHLQAFLAEPHSTQKPGTYRGGGGGSADPADLANHSSPTSTPGLCHPSGVPT